MVCVLSTKEHIIFLFLFIIFPTSGHMRGSLLTLQRLVQLFPSDTALKNDLGVGYLLMGDNDSAKKVYEEVSTGPLWTAPIVSSSEFKCRWEIPCHVHRVLLSLSWMKSHVSYYVLDSLDLVFPFLFLSRTQDVTSNIGWPQTHGNPLVSAFQLPPCPIFPILFFFIDLSPLCRVAGPMKMIQVYIYIDHIYPCILIGTI